MIDNLSALITEARNPRTTHIDELSTAEILRVINDEDRQVIQAVADVLPEVEQAARRVIQSFKNGGRLFYVGAGTSGRIGFLDAVECPPTFGVAHDLVQGIIAGGEQAMRKAVEGAEDDVHQGRKDLEAQQLTAHDTVIGITASGKAPYVQGALAYGKKVGANAIALSCNKHAHIGQYADLSIEVIVGPEVISGSTRMKAATAHKMILNMLSTTVMIKMGKVYENLMVDVTVSNQKLADRAKRIVMTVTGADEPTVLQALEACNQKVKNAIVMIQAQVSAAVAQQAIDSTDGFVRQAIGEAQRMAEN